MQQDYDSSASGYLMDSFEGISRKFTDVTIVNTSDVNIVAKAKRYGRWWLLKGLNQQVANETAYIQRLEKNSNCSCNWSILLWCPQSVWKW